MSPSGYLPIASDAHNIGANADQCFMGRRPQNWRPQNVGGTDDFGVDYQVQTIENNQVADIFRVQLKGTTVPTLVDNGSCFSIQLNASTVRYYARFTEPILLVLCDLSASPMAIDCPLYYVWIQDELRRINSRALPDEQTYINLRVPKENVLNAGTNLSGALSQFRVLANIGPSLRLTVDQQFPGLDDGGKIAQLGKIPRGFSERNPALMESMAEDPVTFWPDKPVGSLVWYLSEAERHFSLGAFPRAQEMLAAASVKLETATPLDLGEYWYLQGRLHLANLCQESSCEAFQRAIDACPNSSRYIAAWAETKMGIAFALDGHRDLLEVHDRLQSTEPAILGVKARLLAAEKRDEEAEAILDSFSGVEQLSNKAIIRTTQGRWQDVVEICSDGLALGNVKDATRLLFLILKSKAQFHLAIDLGPEKGANHVRIPLFARSDTSAELLNEAWNGMQSAMEGLRIAGWPINIEIIADVISATASILQKEGEALGALADAAEKRPGLQTLQAAVESLATRTGNFDLALKANSRRPVNSTSTLQKVCLLHMANRDAECVSYFESHLIGVDRSEVIFDEALTSAILSADRLVKTNLVKKWMELFDDDPRLAGQKAILKYALTISNKKARRPDGIATLFNTFCELGKPSSMAMQLFFALNPHRHEEAEKIMVVVSILNENRLFPLDAILHLGQAYATLERWDDLLAWISNAQIRFPAQQNLIAVKALSLDRLGHAAEARALLLPLIEQGSTDKFVLNAQIDITTRCGFIEDAIAAAEILALSDPVNRLKHLRLLHNLIRVKSPSDPRAHDIAWRMGELAEPDNEVDEGIFLMSIAISPSPSEPDPVHIKEYQERLRAYSAKFPDSSIMRSATVSENASADELMAILSHLIGESPEQLAARQRRDETLAKNGRLAPFAWRPALTYREARDVPQLWEICKAAKGTDPRAVLPMIQNQWTAFPWSEMKNRTPVMDLLTLLVTYDLGILDLLFELFAYIAIPQLTMFELGRMADPLGDSANREKCFGIQRILQAHFTQLHQPRLIKSNFSEDTAECIKTTEELKSWSRQAPYLLYSDDSYIRIFCQENDPDFQGICTLDVLSALEQQGLLSSSEVSEKIGTLCIWGVGVAIEQRWQVCSLPAELATAKTLNEGVEIIRNAPQCAAIFSRMWDREDVNHSDLLNHAGSLVAGMLLDFKLNPVAVASLMVVWHGAAIQKPDSPPHVMAVLARLIAKAATHIFQKTNAPEVSGHLWHILFLLVPHVTGKDLDDESMADILHMMTAAAVHYDLIERPFSQLSLGSFLESGSKDASPVKPVFRQISKYWRKSLIAELGVCTPTPGHLWERQSMPAYWRSWQRTRVQMTVAWTGMLATTGRI